MNVQSPAVDQTSLWKTSVQPARTAPDLRAFAPQTYSDKLTGKYRGFAGIAAISVQALVGLALVYGSFKGVTAPPPPPMIVNIIEKIEDLKPPPPPLKPLMQQPTYEMNLPQPPQIYEPPPLVKVQAPPSPIVAAVTPVRSDPNAAIMTFQQRMLMHVNRNLRYPAMSRSKHHEGVVLVHFTMDRRGNILAAAIERPSGYEALNEEGVAVLKRAQPFPAPPPEIEGDPVEMILPVKFSLREFGGRGSGRGGRDHGDHEHGERG